MATRCIVVAWTVVEPEWDGRMVARDLGQRPRFVDVTRARACVWALRGDEVEIVKAERFIAREHAESGRVFSYPVDEAEPIERAKREILQKI
jgi:hypothetical protein